MNDGSQTASAKVSAPSGAKPIAGWIFSGVVLLVELLSYVSAPGYYLPFLNNSVGKIVLGLAFAWQMLGLALICVPRSPVLAWPAVARFIVIPFFIVPISLVMLLGPACLTIFDAIGPVMDTTK